MADAAALGGGPSVRPSVVVAMLTYRRADALPDAIETVCAALAAADADASLLVVDNDPDGSAMGMADRWADRPVRFVHEPRPGIAAARNRALDEAGSTEVLVFIDDDERPEPGWLERLLDTWHRTGADAVVGPVVSELPEQPDPFLVEGGFFVRRRLPTGTEVAVAATNNLLLDMPTIRRLGIRFDDRFGIIGGSDTLFTRQLHRCGARLVWCDEAVVTDVVPPSRLSRQWVMRRALRLGNSTSRVDLALERGPWRRARRRVTCSGRGCVRIAGGVARVVLGAATGSARHRARGARTLARGVGMLAGAWGYAYGEYRRDRHAR